MPFFKIIVGLFGLICVVGVASDPAALVGGVDSTLQLLIAAAFMLTVIIIAVMTYRQILRSKSQLIQSQALFEGVFEQSFQHIAILDVEGQVSSANLALQRMIGAETIKFDRPIWHWLCWENACCDKLKSGVEQAVKGQLASIEVILLSPDKGRRFLEVGLKPIVFGQGQQVLLEARDVTTRRQTEERLRESEVGYRLLYEHQPVMLLAVDQQARIQSVNQFAVDLLGYSKRELLGHKVTDFYAGDDGPPQQMMTPQDSGTQPVWRRELEYRDAKGNAVWIRETIRYMPSSMQLLLVGEDITDNQKLRSKLEFQASHDHLTHLYNRSFFEMALAQKIEQAQRNEGQYALFFIDLDQFKIINDTAGHEAGDEALKQIALALRSAIPSQAMLARIGGDEFAILLPESSLHAACELGTQLLELIGHNAFYWQNSRFTLNASIGLRYIDSTSGSPQQVHAQADTACYAAKEEGRNRLHVYHEDDAELKQRELEMMYVNRIHRALAEARFELYAQQILPLEDDAEQGHHYEILVRMRDEQGQMASPGVFLPAAERYNLAHLIDHYVIDHTLSWLEEHPTALQALSLCSINLSGQSMGNSEFVAFLLQRLKQTPVPAQKICLEITETAAISNMSEAIPLFKELKSLGCQLALDDFGSGLSSFGYLKRIPVDLIKIDGMFVRDIASDEMDFAMVKAINELAKTMGKKTVAEFVESAPVLSQLRELGVDYAQGYLLGAPRPLSELVAHLSEQQHEAVSAL